MPNRIIRESARTSATLYLLSHGAERMFWRLTTVADDYGRFEADPRILRAACFPLWGDRLKIATVAAWYDEMRAAELIQAYQDNGKTYGVFTTWERHQRVRARHSKYPPPSSAYIGGHMPASDNIGGHTSGGHVTANVPEESRSRGVEESRSRGGHNRVVLADDRFIAALKANPAYADLDVDREIGKLEAWLLTPRGQGKQKTRQRIVNWLNRAERPVQTTPAAIRPRPGRCRACGFRLIGDQPCQACGETQTVVEAGA